MPLRFVFGVAQVFAYEPTASSLYLRGRASRVILGGRPAAAASAFFLFFLLCEAVAAPSQRSTTVSRPGAILFGPYPDGRFLTVNCPASAPRETAPKMTPKKLSPNFRTLEMISTLKNLPASREGLARVL